MFRYFSPLSVAVSFALANIALGCGSSDSPPGSDRGSAGEAGDGGTAGDMANPGTAGAAEAGQAGVPSDAGSAGVETGVCDPAALLHATPSNARRARSAGFQGDDAAYLGLFDVTCDAPTACTKACSIAGGNQAMCDASECLANGQSGSNCAPPPVWSNLDNIQVEDTSAMDMCQLILVQTGYRDALLTDRFKLEIPRAATIRGITVDVRRIGDDSVSDESVRIIKGGQTGSAERASPDPWNSAVAWVTYGGPSDLWGEEWTADDLDSDDFGVALSAAYAKNVGNTVAYVDAVRVTVSYQRTCN